MITGDKLTALYGIPIEVLTDSAGRMFVVGQPDVHPDHGLAGESRPTGISGSTCAQMLSYPFMVNAVRAGTIVAVVAGAVGWMMVLRKESFAGHTLAVVGFPGAAAATWLGFAAGYGYFAACVGAAPADGGADPRGHPVGFSRRARADRHHPGVRARRGHVVRQPLRGFLSGLTNLLFGTISGVSNSQVIGLLVAAVPCLIALAILGRPLLWASVDPETAAAQGVPVRLLAGAFLVLLGVAAAGTSQVTGSLLVFALLVAPAAAAHQLTARPGARGAAVGAHRRASDLAGHGIRVLHALSDRILGEHFRFRRLPAGGRKPRGRRSSGTAPCRADVGDGVPA